MAKRNENGRSGFKAKPSHLGLKEAYSVLQRDYLGLQNHCSGIEQQFKEMQNNYLILEQSHQHLEQDCIDLQEQKVKLIEKLEKSYDAYNEKYMEVQVLEDKLEDLTKSDRRRSEDKNEELNAENKESSREVFQSETHFQAKLLEDVEKVLSEAGLSLVKTDKSFKVNLLDLKKFEGLLVGEHCIVTQSFAQKLNDLEQSKVFLEKAISSLKEHSENQNRELSRIRDELNEKTEQCLNLHKEIKGTSRNANIDEPDISAQVNIMKQNLLAKGITTAGFQHEDNVMIERPVLERIVVGLDEMCEFTEELKKTITDQSSWIDMLMDTMNDSKRNVSGRSGSNSAGECSKKKRVSQSTSGTKFVSNSDAETVNHPLKSDHSTQDISQDQNYSGAQCTAINEIEHDWSKARNALLPMSSPEYGGDFMGGNSERKIDLSSKSLLAFQPDKTLILDGTREQSVKDDTPVSEKTLERFSAHSRPFTSLTLDSGGTENPQSRSVDVCPMCDVVFDGKYDLARRRSHINGHFCN